MVVVNQRSFMCDLPWVAVAEVGHCGVRLPWGQRTQLVGDYFCAANKAHLQYASYLGHHFIRFYHTCQYRTLCNTDVRKSWCAQQTHSSSGEERIPCAAHVGGDNGTISLDLGSPPLSSSLSQDLPPTHFPQPKWSNEAKVKMYIHFRLSCINGKIFGQCNFELIFVSSGMCLYLQRCLTLVRSTYMGRCLE